MVGFAAPCLVHGCTISNASNAKVYVRVLYEPITGEPDQVFERRSEFELKNGLKTNVPEQEFDKGSFKIRETIRAIEVTRANGQVQEISAPFQNVHGVELDWLFVIDNAGIQSVGQNS